MGRRPASSDVASAEVASVAVDRAGGAVAEWPFWAPRAKTPIAPAAAAPSFSVIIAAHQAAAFIADAVASLARQTLPPLETIVCDDGSTDDLAGALAPYAETVVVIRQPHRGVGAAKDTAARAASGDFVVVLDADDIFLPRRLEALAALAVARPDLDLLTTDAWVEMAGQRLGRYTETYIAFPVENQRRRILERCFLFPHVAVRRERLLAVGGFDTTLQSAVDWDAWIRVILDGGVAGCVAEPLAHYRIRDGSITSNTVRRAAGHVRVAEAAAKNPNLSADERRVIIRTLRDRRRQFVLTEVEQALRDGSADARRQAMRASISRDMTMRTRVKCVASALAPSRAARFLSDRERRTGRSRLGRPVAKA